MNEYRISSVESKIHQWENNSNEMQTIDASIVKTIESEKQIANCSANPSKTVFINKLFVKLHSNF